MSVTVGLTSGPSWSPWLVHVTFTAIGLNPVDLHFATDVPSLFSIAGPIEVTIGCDGGTKNNIPTYIIIAAEFLLSMCVLLDLDTCSNKNNKPVCKVARLLQKLSTTFNCSVKNILM